MRHEASHIKHKDVVKRFSAKLVLYAAVLYGSDYLFTQLQKDDVLFRRLDDSWMQLLAKSVLVYAFECLWRYAYVYNQEMRADREACCDSALAEGGSRCFARLDKFVKEQHPNIHTLQMETPALWRALSGYPTHEERSQMLHAIAEELSV